MKERQHKASLEAAIHSAEYWRNRARDEENSRMALLDKTRQLMAQIRWEESHTKGSFVQLDSGLVVPAVCR